MCAIEGITLYCIVWLTSVGPSVHGLQIESCYNIIFVWLETEQHYILV